jgi:hypothetical protein
VPGVSLVSVAEIVVALDPEPAFTAAVFEP